MQLRYEGKDITGYVDIRRADLVDNAGGELDSLILELNDTKGLWSRWGPEKNHTVQVRQDGFDSGVMYVDEIGQQRGAIILKALPVKQAAKQERIKAWDNVRLLAIAAGIAATWGLTLSTYGVTDQYYPRVDQPGQTDFKFLAWRCLLESMALKVSGGKLIIYDQAYMEGLSPAKTITVNDIDGDFSFKNKSSDIYSACSISWQDIQYTFTDSAVNGPTLKVYDLPVSSIGEAQRFSRGLLRARNCMEKTFTGTVRYDAGLTAGNTVRLSGFGLADGKYFVQQAIHKFIEDRTRLKLRGLLEGY